MDQLLVQDRPNAVFGIWQRARADIEDRETPYGTVRMVRLTDELARYSLRAKGTLGAWALLEVGRDPAPATIQHFVAKYGPVIGHFDEWLVRGIPGPWTMDDGFTPESALNRLQRESAVWDGPMDPFTHDLLLWSDSEMADRTQALDFLLWCRDNDYRATALYCANLGWRLSRDRGLVHPDCPAAFYVWNARCLADLQKALQDIHDGDIADLPLRSRVWLQSQLNQTGLYVGDAKGRAVWFGVTARSLLAYLTTQVALESTGYTNRVRACLECGQIFSIKSRKQIYCEGACRERHKKQRRKMAKQAEGG